MKKFIFTAIAALCMVASCTMPDYEYNGSPNAQKPNIAVSNYTVTVFSSNVTDTKNPTFAVSANRETFGDFWVTRQCTFEPSSADITVKPYTGSVEALRSNAMTVNATASGSIAVTFPAPVGDKTGTTVLVVVAEDTGAVTLVATNN